MENQSADMECEQKGVRKVGENEEIQRKLQKRGERMRKTERGVGEGGGRGEREREKYLSLPEIPGMNGSINSPRGRENYWMECSEYMP